MSALHGVVRPIHLMGNVYERFEVTDLHAGVGGRLQHDQSGAPRLDGSLHSPAQHQSNKYGRQH